MEINTVTPDKKKYIIFDLDGTLTDPFLGITQSVQYALRHFGINVDDLHELSKFIGPPLRESFQVFYGLTEEQSLVALQKYRERFSDIGIFENEVYEGMKDFLEELIEDERIVLMATSKPEPYAKRIADFFDMTQYFTQICGSQFDGTRENKADVIACVIETQIIKDLSQAIMVGDRMHDIVGAKAHGIESIGVSYGYGGTKELTEAGADYIVESVEELRNLIFKNKK